MAINEISQRILSLYQTLIGQGRVKDVKDMADQMGVIAQTFYAIQAGKQNASVDFISRFVNTFMVSADYLFAERGEPFYQDKPLYPLELAQTDSIYMTAQELDALYKASGAYTIRLVPAKLHATYAQECTNERFIKGLSVAKLPMIIKPGVWGFEIGDDGMARGGKGLLEGYWIFGSRVPVDSSQIRNGRVHVVVTDKTFLVRRLYLEEGKYVFKADNPAYSDVTLNEGEIRELWYAHKFLGYDMEDVKDMELWKLRIEEALKKLGG